MSDSMPGSPYFDETPKGILTWPKLLKIGIPVSVISILTGWHFDVLIELILVITGVLTILAITRKQIPNLIIEMAHLFAVA